MSTVDLLIATGVLWGCANPFLRRGAKGLRKVRGKTIIGQAVAEFWFLFERFEYVLPCMISLVGSMVYLQAAKGLPRSHALAIANGLAYACTITVGGLGIEEPMDDDSITGTFLITIGTAICCWDTYE